MGLEKAKENLLNQKNNRKKEHLKAKLELREKEFKKKVQQSALQGKPLTLNALKLLWAISPLMIYLKLLFNDSET